MAARDELGRLGAVEVRALRLDRYGMVQLRLYETAEAPKPAMNVLLNQDTAKQLAQGLVDALIALQP